MGFHFLVESLFSKLLAGSFVFITLVLRFHMAHNDPLNLWACVSIFDGQSGASVLSFNLLGEGRLSVTKVKLISVSSCVHHKLLLLVVISFCNYVSYYVCMFGQ